MNPTTTPVREIPTRPLGALPDPIRVATAGGETTRIRCLVVVTAVTPDTHRALVALNARRPTEYHLLVPAPAVTERDLGCLRHEYRSKLPQDPAFVVGRHLLGLLTHQLEAAGLSVTGCVGDRDPVRAVHACMAGGSFDEVIVVGDGRPRPRRDISRRLLRNSHVPVLRLDPPPSPVAVGVPIDATRPRPEPRRSSAAFRWRRTPLRHHG